MSKIRLIIGLLVILAFVSVSLLFPSKTKRPLQESEQPLVSATIFPIYDIARIIGQNVVDAQLLIPPGASPHTFEFSPQNIRKLEQSDRIFMIGYGLDNWVADLIVNDDRLVIVDDNIVIRSEENSDPHYWLDVNNAKQIAQTIARELILFNPDSTSQIERNLDLYLLELDRLEEFMIQEFSHIQNKKMITFHDAWYYFAKAYGFEIVTTFEPAPGREPTPQYLAELINTIRRTDTHVLYAEPQFSKATIESFLADYDATLVTIDPLGGTSETNSYLKLMQSNARIISQNQ